MSDTGQTRDSAGWTDIIAGLAGGLFAPITTFGFGLPFWVSIPGAVLVFFGVRLALAPRQLFEGFDFGAADRASLDLARDILSEAHRELDALQASTQTIKHGPIRVKLAHLHTIVQRVVKDIEQRPRRVNNVRRLLTYYLPAAARLASGYRILESSNIPDQERLKATGEMIARLDEVFGRYADRLSEEDVDGLDVELKLLESAIREEQPRSGMKS